jgi:hypothetical protein
VCGRKTKNERVVWIFERGARRPVGIFGADGSGPFGRRWDMLKVQVGLVEGIKDQNGCGCDELCSGNGRFIGDRSNCRRG